MLNQKVITKSKLNSNIFFSLIWSPLIFFLTVLTWDFYLLYFTRWHVLDIRFGFPPSGFWVKYPSLLIQANLPWTIRLTIKLLRFLLTITMLLKSWQCLLACLCTKWKILPYCDTGRKDPCNHVSPLTRSFLTTRTGSNLAQQDRQGQGYSPRKTNEHKGTAFPNGLHSFHMLSTLKEPVNLNIFPRPQGQKSPHH